MKKDIKKLKSLKESEINYQDIAKTDSTFWKDAQVKLPGNKKAISIRIDEDVLKWLKKQGKGYQSRINSILKSYMNHHV
jgi:uncharacterized protein (DUF4415 family)